MSGTASGKTASFVQDVADLKLGEHRGKRRVWLEGKKLADVGFEHGVRYQVGPSLDGGLEVVLSASGPRAVSGSATRPVIELLSAQVAQVLGPVERVQAWFTPGAVLIQLHPLDRMAQERIARLNARLGAGQPVRLGSVSHGGGVATDALLRGLGAAGLDAQLAFALDKDAAYLEQSKTHGPLQHGGVSIEADLGDVDPSSVPEHDILEAGLPCISASKAGRSKKHLVRPEADLATADLAAAFLEVVRATQPAVIVLENVPDYADSASADMIRRRLGRFGYELHERLLDGAEWALEARVRWVLVAVTRGLSIDLDALVAGERPATLAEVLDQAPTESWGTFEYLKAHAARHAALGHGFREQLVTPSSTTVPVLRRGYQKMGTTDPRLAHPTDSSLSRRLSPAEHARIKGIPAQLVQGVAARTAHEILGQSVISPAFAALGHLVGAALA